MESFLQGEKGTGEGLVVQMELDRVNVFRSFYGKEWKERLQRAHDWVEEGEVQFAVDYILAQMEYGR